MTTFATFYEVEPFSVYPEALPQPETKLDLLRQRMEFGPEFELWATDKIEQAAQTVAATMMNADQLAALDATIDYTKWRLFGKFGGPLPQGMVMVEHDADTDYFYEEGERTEVDARKPYHYGLSSLAPKLLDAGLNEVYDQAKLQIEDRLPDIQKNLTDIVTSSPEYAFFASFIQPPASKHEKPLNRFWKQVRAGQIEHDVRQRHAVPLGATILPGSIAYTELARRTHRLDDETMIQPNLKRPKSDLDRAREYFLPMLEKAFNELPYCLKEDLTFKGLKYYDDDEWRIIANDPDGTSGYYYPDEAIVKIRRILDGQLHPKWVDGHTITREVSETMINAIFIPDQHTSMTQLLQEVTNTLVKDTIDVLTEELLYKGHYSCTPHQVDKIFLQTLRRPLGQSLPVVSPSILLQGEYDNIDNNTRFDRMYSTGCSYSNYEAMRALMHQTFGTVEQYGPANFKVPMRVILEHAMAPDVYLGAITGNEDMIITLGLPGRKVLTIPGYKLVSGGGIFDRRFGFVIDPNGDPYAECAVTINKTQQLNLANQYEMLGLTKLAASVQNKAILTVDNLVDLIARCSTYSVPRAANTTDKTSDEFDDISHFYTDTLEDFKELVQGDTLHVQCTGASSFLGLSLEAVFGPCTTSKIGGLTIKSGDSKISGVNHQQTVFSYAGKQYILDATPSSNIDWGTKPQPLPFTDAYKQQQSANTPPYNPKHSDLTLQNSKQYTTPEQPSANQQVQALVSGFVQRMMVMFGQPNDQLLYKHMADFAKHDPARKAIQVLLRHKNGALDQQSIDQAITYFESCKIADAAAKRRLKIDYYTNGFLDQLITDMNYLSMIIQRSDYAAVPVVKSIEDY